VRRVGAGVAIAVAAAVLAGVMIWVVRRQRRTLAFAAG